MANNSHEPGSDGSLPVNRAALPPQIPDHVLLRRIGRGSYGDVWLAQNVMGTWRALKIVYRSSFDTEKPYEREFAGIREYEPVSRTHGGLMDVLQVGRNDDAGYFYYVMELADEACLSGLSREETPRKPSEQPKSEDAMKQESVIATIFPEGYEVGVKPLDPDTYVPKTLKRVATDQGRLSFEDCLQVGIALSTALAHLHRHDLVHRDIKPSNVIFVHGRVKLADIGLVARVSEEGSVVGTEGFVPPEGPGTPRADVYSLGKLLYEIATGKDRNSYPEPMTSLADLPDQARWLELNEVVLKACEADPSRRYQKMEELQQDLVLLQAGASVKQIRARERRWRRVTRMGFVTGLVGLLMASVAGSYYSLSRERALRLTAEFKAQQFKLESKENELRLSRQVADTMSHMAAMRVEELLATDRTSEAIAHLTPIIRHQPTNQAAVERLVSALMHRSFALPAAVPLQHEAEVYSVQFSPEGDRVVTASRDGTARIWDARTGRPITPPLKHDNRVRYAEFSPDGLHVVTASEDHTAQVWDARTGQPLTAPLKHEAEVWFAQFSPDGDRVATASSDQTARIWDARTGQPLVQPLQHGGKVNLAQFDPDGQRLVTASGDSTARIWDAKTGLPLVGPLKHGGEVVWAEFSPDGQMVVTADSQFAALLWTSRTGQPLGESMRHNERVRMARFSPDGLRIATASWDGTARIWEARTGNPVTEPLRHGDRVRTACFSPDGLKLVTTSVDRTTRVWDALTGSPLTEPFTHEHRVRWAQFSPDGQRVATASEDKTARLWDIRSGQALRQPILKAGTNTPLELCELGQKGERLVTVVSMKYGLIHDFLPSERSFRFQFAQGGAYGHFSPDGKNVALIDSDFSIRVLDVRTGEFLARTSRHAGPIATLEFCPDGSRLLTASFDHTAQVWDARTGVRLAEPLQHNDEVWSAQFSPDGRKVVTASLDKTARIWDAQTGRPLSAPLVHDGQVHSAQFSADGEEIVTASNDTMVRFWNVRDGRLLGRPLRHRHSVLSTRISPDRSKLLSITENSDAWIWDIRSRRLLTNPLKHEQTIRSAEFSLDGQRVVTASDDRTVRVWDVQTGQPTSEPFPHAYAVFYARFSPTGQKVLTLSVDGSIRIWESPHPRLPTPLWLVELAEALTGNQPNDQEAAFIPPWQTLLRIHQEFSQVVATDYLTYWGKWFLADRGNRAIAPLSSPTVQEYVDARVKHGELSDLTEALQQQPTNSTALFCLVNSVLSEKDLQKPTLFAAAVKNRVTRSAEHRPHDPDAMWTALSLWKRVPDLEEGLAWFNQMITRQPKEVNWQIAKGFFLERSDRGEQARQAYAKALELAGASQDPPSEMRQKMLLSRAGLLKRLNRTSEAQADYLSEWNIAPRDRMTPSNCVDLTRFYNATLEEVWRDPRMMGPFNLASIRQGRYSVCGVQFDIRGVVQLSSTQLRESGLGFPERVGDITISGRHRCLHYLHGSVGMVKDSIPIGRYVVHYANGRSQEVQIIYGEDARGYHDRGNVASAVSRGSATEIYYNPAGVGTRLFRTTWQNPFPEVEIVSMDFVSLMVAAAPSLVAITAE